MTNKLICIAQAPVCLNPQKTNWGREEASFRGKTNVKDSLIQFQISVFLLILHQGCVLTVEDDTDLNLQCALEEDTDAKSTICIRQDTYVISTTQAPQIQFSIYRTTHLKPSYITELNMGGS